MAAQTRADLCHGARCAVLEQQRVGRHVVRVVRTVHARGLRQTIFTLSVDDQFAAQLGADGEACESTETFLISYSFVSLRTEDIDGDGHAEVIVRGRGSQRDEMLICRVHPDARCLSPFVLDRDSVVTFPGAGVVQIGAASFVADFAAS